jgi:hypothetical protein
MKWRAWGAMNEPWQAAEGGTKGAEGKFCCHGATNRDSG